MEEIVTDYVMEKLVGPRRMSMNDCRQRALDLQYTLLDCQYVKRMKKQARSRSFEEAEIAIQGLALRNANMNARGTLGVMSEGSPQRANSVGYGPFVTVLGGLFKFLPYRCTKHGSQRRRTAQSKPTNARIMPETSWSASGASTLRPEADEGELLEGLRRYPPGSTLPLENTKLTELLLRKYSQEVRSLRTANCSPSYGTFTPNRIPLPRRREQRSVIDLQTQTFKPNQIGHREAGTCGEAPPSIPPKNTERALDPCSTMHFPHWKRIKTAGRGRYCVATDLPDSQITQNLLRRMGDAPDVVGGFGPGIYIEGYNDIDFHSLLCVKYAKEMEKKLMPPSEEVVEGVRVVRGFPMEFKKRMENAEAFLAPITYDTFEFLEPHGHISEYRMVQNHFWSGNYFTEQDPEQYTLEDTYPEPLVHDWKNLPYYNTKFRNPAEPSHIIRPSRHPRIQQSDLEALEARDDPPLPDVKTLRQLTNMQKASVRAIPNAQARPSINRKVSDKAKAIRKVSGAVGKKAIAPKEKRQGNSDAWGQAEEAIATTSEGEAVENQAVVEPGQPPGVFGRGPSIHQPEPVNQQQKAMQQPSPDGLRRARVARFNHQVEAEIQPQIMVQEPCSIRSGSKPSHGAKKSRRNLPASVKEPEPTVQLDVPPCHSYSCKSDAPPNEYLDASPTKGDEATNQIANHCNIPPSPSILDTQANQEIAGAPRTHKLGLCLAPNVPCPGDDRSSEILAVLPDLGR